MKHILTSIALILIGFISLNILPVFIGGSLIILGIVMLVERIWPEQIESDNMTNKVRQIGGDNLPLSHKE